jgi:hypothetical protein
MDTFYLTASSAHAFVATEPPFDTKAPLQAAWGSKPRRTNRLTDLALLGALHCAQGRLTPDGRTGIYLGSGQGNVADTSVMLRQILVQDVEPMPLTFINVSSNMPGYYISQGLALTGRNIAVTAGVASFDAAIIPALLDLQSGAVTQALVGAVEVWAYPLEAYRAHLQLDATLALAESSAWMMLSRAPVAGALAQVRLCRHLSDMSEVLTELERLPPITRYVAAGALPASIEALLERRDIKPLNGVSPGYNQSIAAYQLLQAAGQGECESLLYLRGSAEEGLFLMWLAR